MNKCHPSRIEIDFQDSFVYILIFKSLISTQQIKEFLLELSDDPFEVKLRDNYVLLVDEYHESLKRQRKFDQKIGELCSERLLLPAGTIEELYANLEFRDLHTTIEMSVTDSQKPQSSEQQQQPHTSSNPNGSDGRADSPLASSSVVRFQRDQSLDQLSADSMPLRSVTSSSGSNRRLISKSQMRGITICFYPPCFYSSNCIT